MPITILPPSDSDDDLAPSSSPPSSPQSQSSDSDVAAHPTSTGRPPYRPTKRPKLSHHSILVPGDLITSEPQWMRGHGTTIATSTTPNTPSTAITATLPGPLLTTNKLLSITPLHARYTPSIGDLVLGRIISVDRSRWRVDISAPLLALLPLSSINLPGGVLRRRTTADELQMRTYFQEGDLVVAEVQGVGSGDGVANLHTRSLRYGKLRNGVFLAVGGGSRGGLGVVRSKRQVFTVRTANGGGVVEVKLGVNGFVWVSRFVEAAEEGEKEKERIGKGTMGVSISNLDELVSNEIYSSQNDEIDGRTRREIARLCGCITLLADQGVRVDEDTVLRAYAAAVEAEMEAMLDDDDDEIGGAMSTQIKSQLQRRIVQAVVGTG